MLRYAQHDKQDMTDDMHGTDQGWILRCAADEQLLFVILNEVKDPSGYGWPAMR
jgi:hypothetical protein